MIIYQNGKYVVTQSEINKHVAIGKALPDGCVDPIVFMSYDERSPYLKPAEGKKILENFLKQRGWKDETRNQQRG
ncbi:MAG: hypothetical protein IJS17_05530 [Clostridia bacterium]|nr:hypothetical protein [Clostridia bacterium]